ncbi:MAG: S8/S53 family peptidase [Candidatus Kapaibacterium sp.]
MNTFQIIRFTLFFLLIFMYYDAQSQSEQTYRILFKDKGKNDFTESSSLYVETLNLFEPAALERRRKILPAGEIISIEDAPVNKDYLLEIENLDAKILAVSRWENFCTAYFPDTSQIALLSNKDYILDIQKTSSKFIRLDIDEYIESHNSKTVYSAISLSDETDDSSNSIYSDNHQVIDFLNIPYFHHLGFFGEGVRIGLIDSGFRYKDLEAFENINIFTEYDFINKDSISTNQQFDHPSQHDHGTHVLSIVASTDTSKFIGVSPKAYFALAKAENLHYERRIELDWYIEAVEWLESKGVDIINTSLGYFRFDSNFVSYDYSDLSGNTSLASRALNHASRRGVLAVTAAGNYGPNERTITCPADSDSNLVVGSINSNREVSNFSSRGPDALGRTRPHIVAKGEKIHLPSTSGDNSTVTTSGTSLATPVISGSAALLLEAFPELQAYDLKEMLIKSASNHPNKNNDIGYGIPDLKKVALEYDLLISPHLVQGHDDIIRIIVKVAYKYPIDQVKIHIDFNNSGNFEEFDMQYMKDNTYFIDNFESLFPYDSARIYFTAQSGERIRRKPFKQDSSLVVHIPDKISSIGFIPDFIYGIQENSKVFPSEVSGGSGVITIVSQNLEHPNLTIIISDLLGRTVIKNNFSNINSDRFERGINISSLSKGSYFIRIISGNRSDFVKFLIY